MLGQGQIPAVLVVGVVHVIENCQLGTNNSCEPLLGLPIDGLPMPTKLVAPMTQNLERTLCPSLNLRHEESDFLLRRSKIVQSSTQFTFVFRRQMTFEEEILASVAAIAASGIPQLFYVEEPFDTSVNPHKITEGISSRDKIKLSFDHLEQSLWLYLYGFIFVWLIFMLEFISKTLRRQKWRNNIKNFNRRRNILHPIIYLALILAMCTWAIHITEIPFTKGSFYSATPLIVAALGPL